MPEGDTRGEGSHLPRCDRLASPWLAMRRRAFFRRGCLWSRKWGGIPLCQLESSSHEVARRVCASTAKGSTGHTLPLRDHPPQACRAVYGDSEGCRAQKLGLLCPWGCYFSVWLNKDQPRRVSAPAQTLLFCCHSDALRDGHRFLSYRVSNI